MQPGVQRWSPQQAGDPVTQGSTYHSVLGFCTEGTCQLDEQNNLTQVRQRLDGVDYILLDEVSMVSCLELYKISSQLAKSRNCNDLPFGGINIILAGDFAQLPPVNSPPLYSGTVGTTIDASMSIGQQQSSIGKALWHQITTVVILRQNMRQKTQSKEDTQFRTALENMRYAACTTEDIDFLRSRIAGRNPNQPNLASKKFRNVSVITGLNSLKDRLNSLGSRRFAQETGQTLTDFYSVDTLGPNIDPITLKKSKKKKKKTSGGNDIINPHIQAMLWNLQHSASDHVPGKLSLCIGLPVMIRNNDATELCITKGQEGHVAGWQSAKGPNGQLILDTLFVKLDHPAKTIQLEGLPENIVPLTRSSKNIICETPSDVNISISRSQVSILPNFAMTDYASQGKTRDINIVDPMSCKSHMAYYTGLSRGSSASGTAILQGFDVNKITCGASGYLRQEFRELELLDEITALQFNNKLSSRVNGKWRNVIIDQYRDIKGKQYCPVNVDAPLRWDAQNPMPILSQVIDSPWKLIEKKTTQTEDQTKHQTGKQTTLQNFISAKGTIPIKDTLKRKLDEDVDDHLLCSTKKKTRLEINGTNKSPIGLLWDCVDHSCAYDSLMTIIYDIWMQNPSKWSTSLQKLGKHSQNMIVNFELVIKNELSLEEARNNVRRMLYNQSPSLFPSGTLGTNIQDLIQNIFKDTESLSTSKSSCMHCGFEDYSQSQLSRITYIQKRHSKSTSNWFKTKQSQKKECEQCDLFMDITETFNNPIDLVFISLEQTGIEINKSIKLIGNGQNYILNLRGIIYLGAHHFTARIVTPDRNVWYHDGISTGQSCLNEGYLSDFSKNSLMTCKGRQAVVVVYTK
jgi:PIF1-like helicase